MENFTSFRITLLSKEFQEPCRPVVEKSKRGLLNRGEYKNVAGSAPACVVRDYCASSVRVCVCVCVIARVVN